MRNLLSRSTIGLPLGVGLALGLAVTLVDNFAFGGEVSPIVIVALLLAATASAGITWGGHGWIAAVATWICIPASHLVKHAFGLPDTLHPNTYASILILAAFTLLVSAIGLGVGALIRRVGGIRSSGGD